MRIVVLIICLCVIANPQAGERWLYSEYAETDALASVYQGVQSETQPIPPNADALVVYFSVATDCMPYFQVLTRDKADTFQLRVDDGKSHEFRWFNSADDGVIATTIAPGDEDNQQLLQDRVDEAYRIARDLMDGNAVQVTLQPSGKVLRWQLDDNGNTIVRAYRHCAVGIEDQVLP